MPNGASAPGKVSPPLVVPMNGLTSDAGLDTGAAAGAAGAATAALAGRTRDPASVALAAMPRTAAERHRNRRLTCRPARRTGDGCMGDLSLVRGPGRHPLQL